MYIFVHYFIQNVILLRGKLCMYILYTKFLHAHTLRGKVTIYILYTIFLYTIFIIVYVYLCTLCFSMYILLRGKVTI